LTLNYSFGFSDTTKQMLFFGSALIGVATLAIFSFELKAFSASQNVAANVTTWLLWALLDVVIFWSLYMAGKKAMSIVLLGYAVGAIFVAGVLLSSGVWKFGYPEALTAVGTIVAIYMRRIGPKAAIVAASMAMVIAGLPTMGLAWTSPMPWTWWLWASSVVTFLMQLAATDKWVLEDRFLPVAGLIFNAIMTVLVLRPLIFG
jgi:hypothetical protein